MADVELPERPLLSVIPDVELLEVGMNWPLMSDGTEDGTFTPEDLAAAVAAYQDPSVRAPVVKFGHTAKLDPLGDGAPVWGRAINLRTTNDGMTLVCDLAGVPAWLADVMASAWPSRSVEGTRNATSDIGRTHDLVINAVALLGVELPAISTLAEVRAVWAARTPDEANVTVKEPTMPTKAKRGAQVTASVTDEDVLRAYYDSVPSGDWSWVRLLQIAPTIVALVDDNDGRLWRIPVTVDGDDNITFGDAVEVQAPSVDDYVPVAAATSASRGEQESIVFASRNESREGVAGMDVAQLRKALNLGDDVSDEDVVAQAAAKLTVPPEGSNTNTNSGDQGTGTGTADTGDQGTGTGTSAPTTPPASTSTTTSTEPTPPTPPPGFTLIADANLQELQQGAAAGIAASQTLAKQAEDAFIARHRRRIGPESNPAAKRTEDHLRREWQRNQGEAEAFASILPERMATAPHGHEGGAEDTTAGQFNDLVSAVWPTVAAVRAEREKRGS